LGRDKRANTHVPRALPWAGLFEPFRIDAQQVRLDDVDALSDQFAIPAPRDRRRTRLLTGMIKQFPALSDTRAHDK